MCARFTLTVDDIASLAREWPAEVDEALAHAGCVSARVGDRAPALAARLLADGFICGWYQGRAEFGPRALGARSILGDPRNPQMQSQMNIKIKFREGFRPFSGRMASLSGCKWLRQNAPCGSYRQLPLSVARDGPVRR